MVETLIDLSAARDYGVQVAFTVALDPLLLFQDWESTPYAALPTDLYLWEAHANGEMSCEYIGRRAKLSFRKRCEKHAKLTQLLARHVNTPNTRVMFRACKKLDVIWGSGRYALSHLPPDQATRVLSDVEAELIYVFQPGLNEHHKNRRKHPWKPFSIEAIVMGV
jgi:hypothetical protein